MWNLLFGYIKPFTNTRSHTHTLNSIYGITNHISIELYHRAKVITKPYALIPTVMARGKFDLGYPYTTYIKHPRVENAGTLMKEFRGWE